MTTTELRTVKSFCRICTSVCGILVDVAPNGSGSDDVVRVHGDPAHPLSRGYTAPVVVETPQGAIVGVARVDDSIRRGAVSVPHGHEGANVNRLTDSGDIDRTTGMAHYSGLAVTLRPAGAS